MSKLIKLKKGLDLPLEGAPAKTVLAETHPELVALKPTDFKGLVPKLLVKEGDIVKVGTPLFADKTCQDILFTSPVAGAVQSVVRGEKRKLLAVVVKTSGVQESEEFAANDNLSAEQIKALLLRSGLWASLIQRPYGVVANPAVTPKAIFVSGFTTSPCGASVCYTLKGQTEYLQAGVNALAKMTGAPIHVSLSDKCHGKSALESLVNVEHHTFNLQHPTGNVGIQIHHICPIRKGETVWTVAPAYLAAIGKLVKDGVLDFSRLVAVGGPMAKTTGYVKTVPGACANVISEYVAEGNVRIISGDVLSGENIGAEGYLGFHDTQFSLVEEGDYYEMFGWMNPLRCNLHSNSHAYLSSLLKKKKFAMDTNLHGGVRPFMFNNLYSDVLPMHLFPVYLAKACLAKDIDKMEQYGIYEVLPEDLALCEYVCPSKIEWQQIISDGIDLMLKEMA